MNTDERGSLHRSAPRRKRELIWQFLFQKPDQAAIGGTVVGVQYRTRRRSARQLRAAKDFEDGTLRK